MIFKKWVQLFCQRFFRLLKINEFPNLEDLEAAHLQDTAQRDQEACGEVDRNKHRLGSGSNEMNDVLGVSPTHYRLVVSNIFYFHSYLGKILILTNIFQRG